MTEAERKVQEVINILFPPLRIEEDSDGEEKIKYMVDSSIDNNLYAVLIDLQEGINDDNCQKTLNSCITALNKVRTLLEAYMQLDEEAKYIIVESPKSDVNVDEIE